MALFALQCPKCGSTRSWTHDMKQTFECGSESTGDSDNGLKRSLNCFEIQLDKKDAELSIRGETVRLQSTCMKWMLFVFLLIIVAITGFTFEYHQTNQRLEKLWMHCREHHWMVESPSLKK